MKYRVSSKKIGTRSFSTHLEIETDSPITQMFQKDDEYFGFLCPQDSKVIGSSGGAIDHICTLDGDPLSISYCERSHCLFVVERDFDIKEIDIVNNTSRNCVSKNTQKEILELISSFLNCGEQIFSSVTYERDKIVCTHDSSDRIFIIDLFGGVKVIGKQRGFSVSSSRGSCRFCMPKGVATFNDAIYVCDTGNHCIRSISKNDVKVVAGNPSMSGDEDGSGYSCRLESPRGINMNGKTGFFLDGDKIKSMSLSDNAVSTIYQSKDKLIAVNSPDEKKLFILEEIKDASD